MTALMGIITRPFWAPLLLLAGLFAGWQTMQLSEARADRDHLKVDLAAERLAREEDRTTQLLALAAAVTAARENERELQTKANETQEKENAQIESAAVQRDALIERLRRANKARAATDAAVSRATATAGHEEAAPVGDGPVVSDALGDDLISEFYRAEQIRAGIESCYRQYDDAVEALKPKEK